jgi:spermidine/putrescine transport system permease protein
VAIANVARTEVGGDPGAGLGVPARSRRRSTPYLLLLPGLAWLAIFFVVPIVTLFGTSLQTPAPSGEIGAFEQTFRLANYGDAVTEYLTQLSRSFLYAGTATVLCLLIGYPLAYMIAFKAGRWRNLLLVLVVAPFFCSFILRTLAWRQILGEEGFIVRTLKGIHVVPEIAGLTYNFLPFMTLPLYASIERLDPRLLEAGADLYGHPLTVLRKVTLPLTMPGIVAGTLLTFIPAAGDYVNAALLGGIQNRMIGNVIESRFFQVVDYPTAAALSFVLMATILVLVFLYIRRAGTEELV